MNIFLTDIALLWRDFIAFVQIPRHWNQHQWVRFLMVMMLVPAAFIIDFPVHSFLTTNAHGALQDALFGFGRWYGVGWATLAIALGAYGIGSALRNVQIRRVGLLTVESFLFSGIITTLLKAVLGRHRPYTGDDVLTFSLFTTSTGAFLSLPSGHATVVFALSATLAEIMPYPLWKFFWYLLAIIGGVSRIYHNQHWLSDVVLAGTIGISVSIWLVRRHAAIT
jgi:membrane-associated phospholipid phosphatase